MGNGDWEIGKVMARLDAIHDAVKCLPKLQMQVVINTRDIEDLKQQRNDANNRKWQVAFILLGSFLAGGGVYSLAVSIIEKLK